ncbi:short-chain dehydrogenase [Mycolicibacterium peregrinum]|uniref:Short-chain dehydrogenase n=1 Tax=Mycolicibacterium peregrinum TaxID=43304 RepID=A0A1A0QYA4_MYCPR|nr:SDR family oxidoreductase [Mycolicibacterium peregrinum]OBB27175.1 short-chain dehydrogenase [Mycolicibacterium peregrinum]
MSAHEGSSVVVTGGASGIGREVARRFAAEGARVVVADLDEVGAKAVAAEFGDNGRPIRCDVTERGSVESAIALAVDEFGRLDVMVNNAGVCTLGPLHLLDDRDFDRMIAVNLKGTFRGIRAAVSHMPSGGAIINVASTAGLNGAPLLGGYGATKAGIINMTKTAAAELRPLGIRVNCVCPALVETPFSDALVIGFEAATGASAQAYFSEKQGRIGQPEDVAKVVLHLASQEAGWVTGVAYPVDGGLMAASI